MRDHNQLRALCRDTLRQLGLRPPLDVALLADRLGAARGKPIDLVPEELDPAHAFGITGGDHTCDVIMYQVRTTRIHQLLIILHELAHIIAGHPRHSLDHSYNSVHTQEFSEIAPSMLAEVLDGARSGPTTPNPEPSAAGGTRRSQFSLRHRSRAGAYQAAAGLASLKTLYDNPIEWEAETMATIMLGWVDLSAAPSSSPPPGTLESIVGDVPEW